MNITDRKFLVTGPNSFLGIHLVSQLASFPVDEIILYSRQPSHSVLPLFPENIHHKLRHVQGELQVEPLSNAMEGVSGVFHIAGIVIHSRTGGDLYEDYPKIVFETNVDYSVNVVNAAAIAKVKRVVIASTSGVVGCRPMSPIFTKLKSYFIQSENETPNDDSPYCTEVVKEWPYYLSKIISEQKTLRAGINKNVEVIWMRPSMMIGPGDINYRSIKIIVSFLHQSTPIIPNGKISVVDVRDAAAAFIAAMERGRPYRGYLLASLNCPLKYFYDILEQISNSPPPRFHSVPDFLIVNGAKVIDIYNRYWQGRYRDMYDPVRAEMSTYDWSIDCSYAMKELNFKPRDVRISIEDTLEWLHEHPPKLDSKL